MVVGWLTRLVVVLGVLGVLGLDVFGWASARVAAQDQAEAAGRAATAAYAERRSLQAAYDAGLAEVVASGDTIETTTFRASQDGAVTLTLHREASTLVLHRIGPLRHLTQLTATVTTRPTP